MNKAIINENIIEIKELFKGWKLIILLIFIGIEILLCRIEHEEVADF